MSSPQLLVVLRHAESARNAAKTGKIFFNDADQIDELRTVPDHENPVTEAGIGKARDAGRQLRDTFGSFDVVMHSGYRRTLETMAALLEAWTDSERASMQIAHHLLLRERDGGYAFNFTETQAATAFPWLQEYWRVNGPFFSRPPGGESLADVAQRVHQFLESSAAPLDGKRVLLVTHGGTLRMFRYWLEGWTYEAAANNWHNTPVPNCSYVAYERNADGDLVPRRDDPITR